MLENFVELNAELEALRDVLRYANMMLMEVYDLPSAELERFGDTLQLLDNAISTAQSFQTSP